MSKKKHKKKTGGKPWSGKNPPVRIGLEKPIYVSEILHLLTGVITPIEHRRNMKYAAKRALDLLVDEKMKEMKRR